MGGPVFRVSRDLALAGFETALCLVDHVNAALAAHNTAIAMPVFQRSKRVSDFHRLSPCRGARAPSCVNATYMWRFCMVGDTGIEPVTPSMSTKCSTAELIALYPKQIDAGQPRVGPAFYTDNQFVHQGVLVRLLMSYKDNSLGSC